MQPGLGPAAGGGLARQPLIRALRVAQPRSLVRAKAKEADRRQHRPQGPPSIAWPIRQNRGKAAAPGRRGWCSYRSGQWRWWVLPPLFVTALAPLQVPARSCLARARRLDPRPLWVRPPLKELVLVERHLSLQPVRSAKRTAPERLPQVVRQQSWRLSQARPREPPQGRRRPEFPGFAPRPLGAQSLDRQKPEPAWPSRSMARSPASPARRRLASSSP